MRPTVRKNLARAVMLMCAIVVLSFASVLLNGTVFFFSGSDQQDYSEQYFDGLITGEPELRRIDKQLVWVTHLSTAQKNNSEILTGAQVSQDQACDISQDYCILLAETQRSGINLQYTSAKPAQLPIELPWFGGFVNPINGSVYDLLGRAYLFQGPVDSLAVIKLD